MPLWRSLEKKQSSRLVSGSLADHVFVPWSTSTCHRPQVCYRFQVLCSLPPALPLPCQGFDSSPQRKDLFVVEEYMTKQLNLIWVKSNHAAMVMDHTPDCSVALSLSCHSSLWWQLSKHLGLVVWIAVWHLLFDIQPPGNSCCAIALAACHQELSVSVSVWVWGWEIALKIGKMIQHMQEQHADLCLLCLWARAPWLTKLYWKWNYQKKYIDWLTRLTHSIDYRQNIGIQRQQGQGPTRTTNST